MNSITFFLFFIPTLGLILLGINLIFAPHNAYQEKSSTFECGFHSFLGQNRTQFSISFFVFALLFLVFDLELVLALPGLINMYTITEYGISFMIIFLVVLTVGFVFELGKEALSIDSRQFEYTKQTNSLWLVCSPRIGILLKNIFFMIMKIIIAIENKYLPNSLLFFIFCFNLLIFINSLKLLFQQ